VLAVNPVVYVFVPEISTVFAFKTILDIVPSIPTEAGALTSLEFLVGFLQAFVFAVLTCVYLNDVVNIGHHH
jgi:F0F1-type ATP synthase membrane subunit a